MKRICRRDFSQLAAAAMSGVVAGSIAIGVAGCGSGGGGAGSSSSSSGTPAASASATSSDMHACAGLNGCKGQGADGKNACAGQGGCASAAMHHECKGHNACKGQGGCGEMLGENSCKGQGSCAVPIKDEAAWKKARDKFEAEMKAEGKEVGPAPAKA
jgi:hypothetical protein